MAKDKKESGKKKAARKEKTPVVKEEVCEVFDVERNGKEQEIKSCGIESEKDIASKEQLKKEKKTLWIILAVVLGLAAMFFAVYFIMVSQNNFEYKGVKFTIDKTDLVGKTLYKTSLPVTYNGSLANYNFYLRTDPRTFDTMAFNGSISLLKNMVLNTTNNLNCGGSGVIAVANVVNLYSVLGVKVIKDENASCDLQGRYMYLNIQEANETKIVQFGPSCYDVYVNNCEILPATEKFMVETLAYVNSVMSK